MASSPMRCTADRQAAFLKAFTEVGTVTQACNLTGVPRRSVYDWIAKEPAFAQAYEEARDAAADVLEAECRRRAQDGVAEPVYYQGQIVGYTQRFSDICLLALLHAYRPERFGRRPREDGQATPETSAVVRVSYDHHLKPDGMA